MDIKQIVSDVTAKYQQDISRHSRDDLALTLIIETALAEAISLALLQHLDTHPGKNLSSAG